MRNEDSRKLQSVANQNQLVSHGTTTTPSGTLHTKICHPTQYKYQNDNVNRRRRLLQHISRPELIIFPTPLHAQHPRKQQNNFQVITTNSLTLAEKRVDNYYYAPLLARTTRTTNEPVFTFDKKLQQSEAKMTNLNDNMNTRRKTIAQRDSFRENANKGSPSKSLHRIQRICRRFLCRLDHTEEKQYHNPSSKSCNYITKQGIPPWTRHKL
jgi:hypothetical protein